jgi:hypothetical protein
MTSLSVFCVLRKRLSVAEPATISSPVAYSRVPLNAEGEGGGGGWGGGGGEGGGGGCDGGGCEGGGGGWDGGGCEGGGGGPSNRRPSAVTVNPPRTGPPEGEIEESAGSR